MGNLIERDSWVEYPKENERRRPDVPDSIAAFTTPPPETHAQSKKYSVNGIAVSAKAGALVKVEYAGIGEAVYVIDDPALGGQWPDYAEDEYVVVTGHLTQENFVPVALRDADSGWWWSQFGDPDAGHDMVLRDVVWKLA